MEIYAEWYLYGEFYNGFFSSWEEFYSATFCPDIEVTVIKTLQDGQVF